MNALLAHANQMAAAGLSALLNSLWYVAAVAGICWAALRLFPRVSLRINAATRYWVWVSVLVLLLAAPFLPHLLRHARVAGAAPAVAPAPTAAPSASAIASARRPAVLTLTLPDNAPGGSSWPLWLLAAWLAAAVWQLGRLGRGLLAVRRLKRRAEPAADIRLPLALRRRVRVLTSAGLDSPVAVVGYLHPAVIVQPGLLGELDDAERRDVLLHELAHLARYDDWVALAIRAVAAVLVLHPLTALVMSRIEREREMACDDFVVASLGAEDGQAGSYARSYARSLARVHDLRWATGSRLLTAEFLGGNVGLADRIESLLRRGRRFSASPSRASLVTGALLLALLLGAGGLLPHWIAIAETVPGPKAFAAASIKPATPDSRSSMLRLEPGGRFVATNVPLRMLITLAYDIRPSQLEGLPSWANSKRFSIQAVAPPDMPSLSPRQNAEAERRMLRALLASRFALKVHMATKQLPIYRLVVAKGGPKLQKFTGKEPLPALFRRGPEHRMVPPGGPGTPGAPISIGGAAMVLGQLLHLAQSADPPPPASGRASGQVMIRRMQHGPQGRPPSGMMMMAPGRFAAYGVKLSALADALTNILGRMVINKTGLTGKYDFNLTWTPEPGERGAMSFGGPDGMKPNTNFSGPSIFTALHEQMGLELKSGKGPVQVVVVDHISMPTAN